MSINAKALPYSLNGYGGMRYDAIFDMFRKIVCMAQINHIEKGLVLNILDRPNDPALRNIYADWLMENSRDEEAQAERKAAEELTMPALPIWPNSGAPMVLQSGYGYTSYSIQPTSDPTPIQPYFGGGD